MWKHPQLIKEVVGYKREIRFDKTKPDETPRKLLDVTRLNNTGWRHKTELKEVVEITYQWLKENCGKI